MRDMTAATALFGLVVLILGCSDDKSAAAQEDLDILVAHLVTEAKDGLVFIEGGTFTMGDFGAVGDDGVWRPYFPPTIGEDQPHEVALSSYSLSRHKTTWGNFDVYLLANALPLLVRGLSKSWEREAFEQDPDSDHYVGKPAQVTWQEAKRYCQWLGMLTQAPYDLPTSAQWEFAGRNRGSKDWIYSTHDGKSLSHEMSWHVHDTGRFVPVGSRLPPNPLGIYDMADNGKEWVNDWFSETWYRENQRITDPSGPATGSKKVLRNLDFSFSRIGMPESLPSALNEEWDSIPEYTFRCALRSPVPASEFRAIDPRIGKQDQ